MRKHPIEFMTYPFTGGHLCCGYFRLVQRWQAALHAREGSLPNIDQARDSIEEKTTFIDATQSRRKGYDWKDANIVLHQVMKDYAESIRS